MSPPFRLTSAIKSEHELQIEVANMLYRLLLPDVAWTSVDLANAKDEITGKIRKARGCRSGCPDILLWHQGRGYGVELKALNGSLSAAQKAFHDALARAGIPVEICRTSPEVFAVVQQWGLTRRARIMA